MSAAAALALVLGLMPGHASAEGEVDAAVAAYLDAWNGTAGRIDDVLAPEFVDTSSLIPLDAALFKAGLTQWRLAVPDLKVTMLERYEASDAIVLRLRYEGHPAHGRDLTPLTGGALSIEQIERLSLRGNRMTARKSMIDEWTLPLEWMFVPPPSNPLEPHTVQRVATFGAGRFLESIARAPDGALYVSTGIDGGIARVGREGSVQSFADVDVGHGGFMMFVALDSQGALFATVNSRDPANLGVWRFNRDGHGRRISALPAGAVPNGLAFDGRGHLLVADSFGGLIWQVPVNGGEAREWLRHRWLSPRPLVGRFPGANGLQRDGNSIIVAVSDRSQLVRVPIEADGKAGEPSILSSTVPADDFAVAPDGTLYLTTHPFNTVVRLTRDGRQTVIAGPAQGVAGPTAAIIGSDGWLYVATDGGLYRPLPGTNPTASVVRIRLKQEDNH